MEYDFSIRGEIGDWWLGVTAYQVVNYLNRHKDKSVDIAICSPGGNIEQGLEMYQAFKDHGNVHAHIIGLTASAATVVAMGAKTVDIAKGSLVLIHNAWMQLYLWQGANKEEMDEIIKDIEKSRDDLKTMDKTIAGIYAERCGKDVAVIEEKMKEAKWLTADDAVSLGIVDNIRDDEEDAKISNKIQRHYMNSIVAYGMPAIPGMNDVKAKPISFRAILNAFKTGKKDSVKKETTTFSKMKKHFKNICQFLGVDGIETNEKNAAVTVDDLQKIEDSVATLQQDKETAENKVKDLTDSSEKLQQQIDTANKTIKSKEEEIENLKNSAGDKPDDIPHEDDKVVDTDRARKMFNAIP